jgi:hypothetical protein
VNTILAYIPLIQVHLGVGYTIVAGRYGDVAVELLQVRLEDLEVVKSPLLGRLSEASSVISSIAARRVAPSVKPGAALALPDQQLICFFFFL